MSAEQSAAAVSGSPEAQTTTNPAGESLPALGQSQMNGLMQKLGIPHSVRETIAAPVAPQEAEAGTGDEQTGETEVESKDEAEKPTGEADESEGETKEEADADSDDDPEGEEETEDSHKEINVEKLRSKERKQRKRAQRAEAALQAEQAKAADLAAKLETATPIQVVPTLQDPLAHVTDLKSLNDEVFRIRRLRDTARANPQGWVANEGTAKEEQVTAEQSQYWLSWAENTLADVVPQKEQEIKTLRPQARQAGEAILPEMFKAGTVDNQARQYLLRSYPALAAHPESDYLTAVFLVGYKAIAAAQNGNGKNGHKLEVPAAITKAHADKGKVAIQKQQPPGRSTQAPSPKGEGVGNVLAEMGKSGGTRDSLVKGLTALRHASASPRGKDLAPV